MIADSAVRARSLGALAVPAASQPRTPRRAGRYWRYALTGAYVGAAAGAVYGVREARRCDCSGEGLGSPWFIGGSWAAIGGLAGFEVGSLAYLVARIAGRESGRPAAAAPGAADSVAPPRAAGARAAPPSA